MGAPTSNPKTSMSLILTAVPIYVALSQPVP